MSQENLSLFESVSIEAPVLEEESITVFSVSDLNKQIRAHLEGKFNLVWVRGEISNFKLHSSGHSYFALKDSGAQIKAVMFRGFNSRLKFRPADGMEVIVRGRVTVYEPRGDYQITCELMEPVGVGALQRAFEQLKARLQKEGLFESARKRPLPKFPKHIAVVTSPTGAAIQDMLNILKRRYPLVQITLVPTVVQGESAAPKIVTALKTAFNLPFVDVVIVGRGGGSIEDMWCFNDEQLARVIAAAPVPVISAVGHEIDFTIADFVADLRAPTPSAAAELVVPDKLELERWLGTYRRNIVRVWMQQLRGRRQELATCMHRLIDPRKRLQDLIFKTDDLTERLELALKRNFTGFKQKIDYLRRRLRSPDALVAIKRQRTVQLANMLSVRMNAVLERRQLSVARAASLLDSLSPLKVVARGFSITTTSEGELVRSVSQVRQGQSLITQVGDGKIQSIVRDFPSP